MKQCKFGHDMVMKKWSDGWTRYVCNTCRSAKKRQSQIFVSDYIKISESVSKKKGGLCYGCGCLLTIEICKTCNKQHGLPSKNPQYCTFCY